MNQTSPTHAPHLVAALLLAAMLPASAAPAPVAGVTWQPAQAGDLVPARLVAAPAGSPLANTSREPVTFSWPLAADAPLDSAPRPFIAESREYFLRFTGAELARGVPLPTSAPRALLRLNPAPGNTSTAVIDAAQIAVRDAQGRPFSVADGADQIATAEQLATAGIDFPTGTLAFRLRPEVGSGRLSLAWSGGDADPRGSYVVHVFDRESSAVLKLATDHGAYLDGESLQVRVALDVEARRIALDHAVGYVTSPAGHAWPLELRAQKNGSFLGTLALSARDGQAPGLWEVNVQTSATAGGQILRNARTAFAATLPTARLDGRATLPSSATAGLGVRLGVEVASASRYEVRGVLYGTDAATGQRAPLAAASFATWLEPGTGTLLLTFDRGVLGKSALGAPYEIRQLELRDQGRLGLLERHENGLAIQP